MTAPDLHPEDLIERGERGRLTSSERARLEAHVRRCITCRLERMARVDFEREAEPLPEAAQVRRTIAHLLVPTVERAGAHSFLTSRIGRAFLGIALALVASLGIAAVRLPDAWGPVRPTASTMIVSPSAHAAAAMARSAELVDSTSLAVATSPAVDRIGETAGLGLRRRRDPESMSPVSVHAPVAGRPSASTLFEWAAAARHAGDDGRAADLYRSLLQAFPDSPEAHTALALLGRMLLDEGDDASAVVQFDRYLQSKGVLEQDALVGRALALERLGRAADASQAWSALLRSYPNSAHADRARIHLTNLAPR